MTRIEHQNRTQTLSIAQERMLNERDLIAPADTHSESLGDVYIISGGHTWADVDAALEDSGSALSLSRPTMSRPGYEALDANGLPYLRPAKIIGELPTSSDRMAALGEATTAIAEKTGMCAIKNIQFGAPVFTAFRGMNRPKAKHHADAKLLLAMGDDVSLDYCKSYN